MEDFRDALVPLRHSLIYHMRSCINRPRWTLPYRPFENPWQVVNHSEERAAQDAPGTTGLLRKQSNFHG